MVELQALPYELLEMIIENLVIRIGIYKAVLLRDVSRTFNAAILEAICVKQVVDICDRATPMLQYRMNPALRGKIIAQKSRTASVWNLGYVSVVADVNQALNRLIGESDQEAVKQRHGSIAAAVILERANTHSTRIKEQNVLCGAVIAGDLPVVRSLLESNKADVNTATPYFASPLTLAAARGDVDMVQYLLKSGARMDADNVYRYQPCDLGDLAIWARANEFTRYQKLRQHAGTALRSAILGGHDAVVFLLLLNQYRLPVNSLEYLRVIIAGAKSGRLDFIIALFKTIGADLSRFPGLGNEMLWEATRHDQRHVVQWLLNRGVDINAFQIRPPRFFCSALHIAAPRGNTNMVRFLLDQGADVNLNGHQSTGTFAVNGAARCGQEQVMELLIDHGADPAHAFLGAAEGGQDRLIKSLLRRYPNLPYRFRGAVGRETLYRAMVSGNLTIVTILIEAGIHVPWYSLQEYSSPLVLAKHYIANRNDLIILSQTHFGAFDRYGKVHPLMDVRGITVSERTWEWVGKY